MADKKIHAVTNTAGGVDLLIERDAGNFVRINMGNKRNALVSWRKLHTIVAKAIEKLGKPEPSEG